MTDETGVVRKRRTAAEVEQIVNQFEGSGLNRSQFCQRQGFALITLNRYLKRVRGKGAAGAGNGLLAVEVRDGEMSADRARTCGLAVVLARGRRIEVGASFDGAVLQRLVRTLEGM
jgi:hypothetical protein